MKTETQVQVFLHTVYRKQWTLTSTVWVLKKILSGRGVCDSKWPWGLDNSCALQFTGEYYCGQWY